MGFKIPNVQKVPRDQKSCMNQVSAELNFSTSFDPFVGHKVSLDSPWTGLPESEKNPSKMFF